MFPPAGLLVPEDVLRCAGSTPTAIWDALEAAAAPVAVEYHPVSEPELAKLRTIPVNAAAQQALEGVIKALDPKSPTLFRVVLPKGAELVKAAGTTGFRGFSRTGGTTAHAVLKPVAAGGAIAAGWPVLAVAGTVLAIDMMAQREQRAHQRRVEALLGRQEERHYVERIKDQRSADAQLSRAISLMLDGHHPNLELALKSADDEFYRSQQFLEKHRGVVDELVEDDGKVDYRRLEEALGGETKEDDHFVRELHLAQAAIAIRRKATLAEAAAVALVDPTNPYSALRRFWETQVHQLETTAAAATELTEKLGRLELKGRWYDTDKSVAARQERLRARVSPPRVEGDTEIRYVTTSSGEIRQVLPPEEAEPPEPTEDAQDE
ncbi:MULTISPECIES: hypothetical protein [Streptomyces]|uniref:Uncharacterized protein n=1 Tax=Streptomyces solicathayae TaxID=3081768 RepID=A0ABZ0LN91_9ACTN|nr:hypothetical protein [Streptomyces sp. HUAS YS2]WOX20948.1 hypothetical protein R2D22_05900 [Streptomyces sp. HUAS YS2]